MSTIQAKAYLKFVYLRKTKAKRHEKNQAEAKANAESSKKEEQDKIIEAYQKRKVIILPENIEWTEEKNQVVI